ncbi:MULTISPECIES: ROK family protein [unclassified Brachybacterium]|uniref:ROK family protein n=1 Tax=unclassified Brachybacterium TaxID=2623841 RepID=UPI00402A6BA9
MSARRTIHPDDVLRAIYEFGPISRSDLARELGVSRPSVTSIVQEITGLGILAAEIPTRSRQGRRSRGLTLDLGELRTVAVRINRYRTEAGVFDGNGEPLARSERSYDSSVDIHGVLAAISAAVDEVRPAFDAQTLVGVGVAALGWLFRDENGTRLYTDGFTELRKVDFVKEIGALLPGVPIVLEHDAKTSALAEYALLSKIRETPPRCLLNVVGGIGYGGGIVVNGRIFSGAHGIAGEIGHLGINFNARLHERYVDRPGFDGLFEDYASPRALRSAVAERLVEFPDSPLTENPSIDDIVAAFDDGDELATWAVKRMCRLIAYGLASLVYVLDPDCIVLGDLFPGSTNVRDLIQDELGMLLPPIIVEHLELRVSELGETGILQGCHLMAMQEVVAHHSLHSIALSRAGLSDAKDPTS